MGSVIKIDNNQVLKLYKNNQYNKIAKIINKNYENEKYIEINQEEMDENVKNLMLLPSNICFLASVTQDDMMLFSTLLSTNDSLGYFYNDIENSSTTIKLTSPDEVSKYFHDLLGISEVVVTGISLTMSVHGLLALTSVVDSLKRKNIEQLMFHMVDSFELTIPDIEENFDLSYKSEDLRWYLPFIAEAFGPFEGLSPDTKSNINKGLNELQTMGLLNLDNYKIEFTDEGFSLLSILLQKRNLLMLRSLFFEQETLRQMPIAFLNFDNVLYYIMPLDEQEGFVLKSLDKHMFSELVEMVIAPGDMPSMVEKEEIVLPNPNTKFCKYCGAKINASANFCNSCGKSLVNKN